MSLTKVSYSMITAAPVNAVDFGVVVGATDNATALQAAITYAASIGSNLILPAGNINIATPITIDVTTPMGVIGQGSELSSITYTGAANVSAVTITGNYNRRVTMSGFSILKSGTSTTSTGLLITKIYGGMFNDINVSGFQINITCNDVNDLKFLRLMCSGATLYGIYMALGSGGVSYPNLNDFDTCNFINNAQNAVVIDNGCNNTFRTCNFGYNGTVGNSNSASIRLTNSYGGNGGGFVLVENCYFEQNSGKDFWTTCNGPGAYNFINNSFNKVTAGINPTNHIYLDATPLSSGTNLENRLVMIGNSFAKLNNYTGTDEDVLLIYGSGGFTNFVVVDENVYDAKEQTPTTYNLPLKSFNNDRSNTVNKVSELNLLGKDSTGVVKSGGGVSSVSQDKNWVNANLNVYVIKADVKTIAAYFSSTGAFVPFQAITANAPPYIKGGMYFDTTLNKVRIGGATGWETVTST